MLHHAVGHREVGGRVVELDVAREGRPAGEDDRCREDGEDTSGGAERPRLGPVAPGRPEQQPCDSERDHERPGELGGRVGKGRELRREDEDGQPDGQHERVREPLTARCLEQSAAAE